MTSASSSESTHTPAVRHLDELCTRLPSLVACRSEILAAFRLLEHAFRHEGTLYLCGNGGSAADCDHWAGELLKGFERARPVPSGHSLPDDLSRLLHQGLRAVPLTGFTGLRLAVANDIDARVEFAQLVWALGRSGDVLVGMSTSGNAANVLAAVRTARAKNMSVLTLTGASGGQLAPLADVAVRVPEKRTCLVQELHLPVYHTLCLMLEEQFFP